jgi:hypothetical protein
MSVKRLLSPVLIGVLLVLGIVEIVLSVIEEELPRGTTWPSIEAEVKYDLLQHMDQADVVFIGSSITEAAVDPELFIRRAGVSSAFNSALPFSTTLFYETWLPEVVLQAVKPHVVVIGIPPWSGGGTRANDPLLERTREAIATGGRQPGLALLRQAGLFSEWDSRAASDRTRFALTDLGHQTGYYERSIDDAAPMDLPIAKSEMGQIAADAMARLIDNLESQGIEVIVMIEPGRYPGGDRGIDYDGFIASVWTHALNWDVPLLDTFHEPWDRSWFADNAHFNRRGTEEFTNYLASEFRALMGATAFADA